MAVRSFETKPKEVRHARVVFSQEQHTRISEAAERIGLSFMAYLRMAALERSGCLEEEAKAVQNQ